MNLLNRIILAVLCLALAAGAISIIVLAWAIPEDSIDSLNDAVRWLERNNDNPEKLLLTAVGTGVALLTLLIVSMEVWPRPGKEVKVTDLKVGDAVISSEDIGQRVEEAVRQVPNVSDVRATVRPRRKGVRLLLHLHVDPQANLASVTDEASATAIDLLSDKLHVALVDPPRVRLHYRLLRSRDGRAKPTNPSRSPATNSTATPSTADTGEDQESLADKPVEAQEPSPSRTDTESAPSPSADSESQTEDSSEAENKSK